MMKRLSAVMSAARSLLRDAPAADTEYNAPATPIWRRTGPMHRQRYEFAARYVEGRRVLNVACGPGYGENILASGRPTSIVAVDYDQALIQRLSEGKTSYAVPTEYRWANAEDLPTSLGTFDVIVSLENIEHLRAPERFFAGARRLANPGAKLILSTPNRLYYSGHPTRPIKNPYHHREFDFDELQRLVTPFITDVEWSAQFGRDYMPIVNEVETALRTFNSLWLVRLERAARRILDKPLPSFDYLPFETDLRRVDRTSSDGADTFVGIGTFTTS